MFHESIIDKTLRRVKKLIPKSVFDFFAPMYHAALAYVGAVVYGFPSKSMKVIGVTGTKGKSTTVFLISKLLEGAGEPTAAIGSLGFKIKDKEWPNNLKMTMPGRFKLQKFLAEAKKSGCKYVVLEVTSEGIKQKRHLGIKFDCAVFTNLHKEHLESHGSFENYYKAKQELFRNTKNIHVLNADSEYVSLFSKFPAKKKVFFNLKNYHFQSFLQGDFNKYNILAAAETVKNYGVDRETIQKVLDKIKGVQGRMEYVQKSPFSVVVDYAHTPESLEQVYQTLRNSKSQNPNSKLICVLGAAGGGRDKWKRPEFGKIASLYCDQIILTDEDPYDENPETIIKDIEKGFSSQFSNSNFQFSNKSQLPKYQKILDRKEAIKEAISMANNGDTVIITGKGSETSMAVAGGKKIPWSDREIVQESIGLTGNK